MKNAQTIIILLAMLCTHN